MVIAMFPLMAFTSTAATNRVYSAGEWNYADSQINSARNGFDHNGPFFVSMAIADTEFVFMQTQDNQEFTYTTNLYAYKNNFANEAHITFVDTHVERDTTFENMITSSSWALVTGQVNDGGDSSPNGDELKTNWFSTYFTGWSYTENFIANGSAVYHPEWQIEFTSRGAGVGYTLESHNTAYTVIEGENEAQNLDPVLTIRVIDMRELRTLVNMANAANVDITDITGGRDMSGNTYYTQETIDTMVAALRARLLCDYTALDAQLARAAAVEDNVNGGLGGYLYDETTYDAFTAAYNSAKAVDRYLTDDDGGSNQALINSEAAALQAAVDALANARKALINYYVDGELFARNTCELGKDYNFHDVTDKFIGTPSKEHYVFSKWTDINGDVIPDNTLITGDINAYATFEVRMDGVAPLEKGGKWEHKLSENDTDGRGDNYISMWVEDINFNFVQTQNNETFSFYTDLTAYKNDGGNTVRVNDVYLLTGDTDTDAFVSAMGSHEPEIYCATRNSDEIPNNSGLPGALGSGYSYQSTIYKVVWRYIYTFDANGAATYRPKWNIEYTSGLWALSAGDHDLPGGGDPYVQFTINVTDMRPLINMINKAESIYNNPNSYEQFDQDDLDALRSILDFIYANYTLDGSVYYTQTVVDSLVNQIKAVIPDGTSVRCDYTELDAAISLANDKREEYNDNADSHYIHEIWDNFMNAYTAATSVDRTLYIIESNANQKMIDDLTSNLLDAIDALNYQTHVNQPCDYADADDILDVANDINNDNGQYDDTAYQNFEDAKQDLEDLLNLYDDEDGNNQQAVDDAVQALQDAIDALNDPVNQNDPCDYSALNDAIAAAEAINNSSLFTASTYQALQDALADAQAVPTDLYNDDSGNNQQAIDDAADALNNAIAGLLADAIANAGNVDTTGMTSSSAQALEDAVDDAETVAADANSTAGDRADAINGITGAADGLTPDKTELEETINVAEAIDTTNIPQNLADALDSAITDGEAVDTDTDATVQEIKDATDAINDVLDDILAYVIDEAENTDTTGMTPVSAGTLEDAIADAQAVQNDPNATAQDKADAINAIEIALDNLNPDKTELEDALDAADDIDTTNLPQSLADALEDAITDGQTVDADTDATVQEISDATDAIIDAIDDILEYVINEAENTDTTGMTDQSIQDLENTIQDAQDVLNDPNATAQDKADAINDIITAVDSLTPDKTELELAIYSAGLIDTTDVPQNLVDALDAAVANGQSVDADSDATAADVEDATEQIRQAIADILQQVIDDASNADTDGMTSNSIQDLADAIDNAQITHDDANSNSYTLAEAIIDLQSALNDLTPDKTELEEAINAAEGIDTTDLPQNLADALDNAIADGQTVDVDGDATVPEIKDATDAINDAIDDILQHVIDEAENTDTTGMTDESVQALEDAIQDAKDVLNDPDSTAQDKADAIETIGTAVGDLSEVNKLIPADGSDVVVDRADTNCYYLVGLDAADTTFANVKTMFKNDGRQIIAYRDGVQLSDTDYIGTACVIKCVSVKDPTVVYEQATVILYGDVNGDGLVNNTDYDAMFSEALFGQAIEGELFRIAGDLNNDNVIDGFDMAKLELQITNAKALDQKVEYYK